MKLKEFYESTYVPTRLCRVSKRTIAEYNTAVKKIIDLYGDKKIKNYNDYTVTFSDDLIHSGNSAATVAKQVKMLNSIFKVAGKSFKLIPPKVVFEVPKIISDHNFLDLYAAFDSENEYPKHLPADLRPAFWHAIMLLVATTAIRRQAVLGIDWSDIDEQNLLLHIRPDNDKKKRQRTKPITRNALAAMQLIKTGERIFRWTHGGKTWYRCWNEANNRAGTSIHLHDLKRYSALLAFRAGADEMTLKQHLDHSDIATTLIHYFQPSTREMVNRIVVPCDIPLPPPTASAFQNLKLYNG